MQATESIVCEGDGQSGYRVQVLYVYPDNTSSQYNASLVTQLRDRRQVGLERIDESL